MFIYHQRSGEFYEDFGLLGKGYSGREAGLNNPDLQQVSNTGPVPRGRWKLGPSHTHIILGPLVFDLFPEDGTETFGRSLFRLHGDNSSMNHTASDGCIILNKLIRMAVNRSKCRELLVVE